MTKTRFERSDDTKIASYWTVCACCEIEYAEPHQRICSGCSLDLQEKQEAQEKCEDITQKDPFIEQIQALLATLKK